MYDMTTASIGDQFELNNGDIIKLTSIKMDSIFPYKGVVIKTTKNSALTCDRYIPFNANGKWMAHVMYSHPFHIKNKLQPIKFNGDIMYDMTTASIGDQFELNCGIIIELCIIRNKGKYPYKGVVVNTENKSVHVTIDTEIGDTYSFTSTGFYISTSIHPLNIKRKYRSITGHSQVVLNELTTNQQGEVPLTNESKQNLLKTIDTLLVNEGVDCQYTINFKKEVWGISFGGVTMSRRVFKQFYDNSRECINCPNFKSNMSLSSCCHAFNPALLVNCVIAVHFYIHYKNVPYDKLPIRLINPSEVDIIDDYKTAIIQFCKATSFKVKDNDLSVYLLTSIINHYSNN